MTKREVEREKTREIKMRLIAQKRKFVMLSATSSSHLLSIICDDDDHDFSC